MLKKIIFTSVLSLTVAAVAQTGTSAQTGNTTATSTNGTVTGTTTAATTGTAAANPSLASDGEIAKVLITINEGEIDAAQVAVKKAKKQEVRNFAKEMISDHRDNKKETKGMAKTMDRDTTGLSKSVKEDAKTINKQLKKESRDSFDVTYVQSQIDMHQKALDILDTSLIPSAKSDTMRTHLQKTREAVAKHLSEAQDLKTKIQ